MIWKRLLSDCNSHCRDGLQFYRIATIIWKPLSRDCSDVTKINIPDCTASLFVPGPLGNFLFCSDHMETGGRKDR